MAKKQSSLKMWYWTWLLSIVLFYVSLFLIRKAPVSIVGTSLVILGLIVLIGFVAFLSLSIGISRSLKSRNTKIYGLVTLTTFIAFFFILFNYVRGEGSLFNQQSQTEQQTTVADPSISPSPTEVPATTKRPPAQKVTTSPQTNNSNQVNCTGPDGKTFKATQKECDAFNTSWGNAPTPDPNEIVKCNIHPNCGGGYREMTRASCNQMTCCTVDLNNTAKFISKDQCSREQDQSLSKSHSDFCNTMCAAYDSNTCANYYGVGTAGRSNCIIDMTSKKTECLLSCYNEK